MGPLLRSILCSKGCRGSSRVTQPTAKSAEAMGRKKAEKDPEALKPEEKNEEDETDSPVVKKLKEIDDKCLEMDREYEKEIDELMFRYQKRQQPLLDQRREKLMEGTDQTSGTPACRSFWCTAMHNHPALRETIEEYDKPVLEYLTDITTQFIDQTESKKGFRLTFQFAENPYFSKSTLTKEFQVKEVSPYTQEQEAVEIIGSAIDWKPGQDVTVETVAKKVKGGGVKKAKQKAKTSEVPRDSFFRSFFRSYKPGMDIPDDINLDEARAELCDDEDDDEQMLSLLMENDLEIGTAVRDQLIPFAVRWYTGEAAPDMDDDDEESESEDDEDDDDDSPAQKKDPAKKKGGAGGSGAKGQEECKQQ